MRNIFQIVYARHTGSCANTLGNFDSFFFFLRFGFFVSYLQRKILFLFCLTINSEEKSFVYPFYLLLLLTCPLLVLDSCHLEFTMLLWCFFFFQFGSKLNTEIFVVVVAVVIHNKWLTIDNNCNLLFLFLFVQISWKETVINSYEKKKKKLYKTELNWIRNKNERLKKSFKIRLFTLYQEQDTLYYYAIFYIIIDIQIDVERQK